VLEEARVGTGGADAREVANFIRALNWAAEQIDAGMPIAHRLLCGAHERLLKDVRGANKRPGEYKRDQNMIGGAGRDVATARFVPPPPEITPDLMAQLERFINEAERQSAFQALIDIALVHYQFEAIHPFSDGNGRLGRMLISLLATKWKLLDHMLLYVSPELEERKDEYIDCLFAVSARSEWEGWITFFAETVVRSSARIIDTIDGLVALHEEFRERAARVGRSSNLQKVVDELFRIPVITTPGVQSSLEITYAAARNIIEKLERAGILSPIPGTRPQAWKAPAIIDLVRR
jgi:Fic family protein